MPQSGLTGSRIRERRVDLGLRQAHLAEACGISASYLNLIEHNRRRIGGKLLNAIATALGVEPSTLSEGADAALIDALSEASAQFPGAGAEAARAEELAGRFPGWARLVAAQSGRITALERTAEALNDRLAHDPNLAAALHDMLSAVTGIRSSSGILVGDEAVDPEWQARFHRNIHEDSRRLADAARGLVSYLDAGKMADRSGLAPQEELETWLAGREFHFPDLERALPVSPDTILSAEDAPNSRAGRDLARQHLARYRDDAARLPLAVLWEVLGEVGPDPARIAPRFDVELPVLLRRLAAMPKSVIPDGVGLAICDASGTLTFQRPIGSFALPRFASACPLLPLYDALARPMSPIQAVIEQAGRTPQRFLTYAISQPARPAGFDQPTVFEATMLVLPEPPGSRESAAAIPVGLSCRTCSREACAARREPSILLDGAGGQSTS